MNIFRRKRDDSFLVGLKLAEEASRGHDFGLGYRDFTESQLKTFNEGLKAFFEHKELREQWTSMKNPVMVTRIAQENQV